MFFLFFPSVLILNFLQHQTNTFPFSGPLGGELIMFDTFFMTKNSVALEVTCRNT